MGKTLYFEGAGVSEADISKATIGNCRIRTAFHLDNGKAMYIEILCGENKNELWKYTGYITDLYRITDDKPNDDCNRYRHKKKGSKIEYTKESICNFVNRLGASFDDIKVVNDLGGYNVFPEENSCQGLKGYNYGDEFILEPELVEKRHMIYQYFYKLEKREGKKYPNFSLWVDEKDKYVLHLLRHYSGTFKTAHNKHWIIRLNEKDIENSRNWTMKEETLGRYGC